jgi:hypothetical protein
LWNVTGAPRVKPLGRVLQMVRKELREATVISSDLEG